MKQKLLEMVPTKRSKDRLKFEAIYFLSRIVVVLTKTRVNATVVDDLFQYSE